MSSSRDGAPRNGARTVRATERPLTVAIAGAGFLGRGLVNQLGFIDGVRVVALADRHLDKSRAVVRQASRSARAVVVAAGTALERATRGAQDGEAVVALARDPRLLVDSGADVLVDCTGDPWLGAELALAAIERRLPIVSTAEVDATVGPQLARRARERGAVYGGGAGDEHGEVMKLWREARAAGLEVVAAGKFKKHLDPLATPASVRPFAERHAQNPFMLTTFADGTKMSFELACVANATGLVPDVRGMHCPRAEREQVAALLTDGPGGILARRGVVEVVVGAEPSAAVFVVAAAPHPQLRADLDYLKMGSGPAFLLYKPYHLCAIELAASVVRVAGGGEPTIVPGVERVAEVVAIAKRDLAAGERLDRLGGTTFRGVIARVDAAAREGLLPAGLAGGLKLRRALAAGTSLRRDDVEPPRAAVAWRLREEATVTSAASPAAGRPRGRRRSRRP